MSELIVKVHNDGKKKEQSLWADSAIVGIDTFGDFTLAFGNDADTAIANHIDALRAKIADMQAHLNLLETGQFRAVAVDWAGEPIKP